MSENIVYQNKDITSKLAAELFREKTLMGWVRLNARYPIRLRRTALFECCMSLRSFAESKALSLPPTGSSFRRLPIYVPLTCQPSRQMSCDWITSSSSRTGRPESSIMKATMITIGKIQSTSVTLRASWRDSGGTGIPCTISTSSCCTRRT